MDDLGVPLFQETFIFTYIYILLYLQSSYIISFIEDIQPSYINILYSKYHPLLLQVFRFLAIPFLAIPHPRSGRVLTQKQANIHGTAITMALPNGAPQKTQKSNRVQ